MNLVLEINQFNAQNLLL